MNPPGAPLVAHVIHALGVGGLENGLVNLINHMPPGRFRHAIVCMTTYTDFRRRLRDDVEVIAMHRGTVPLWRTYADLVSLFRRLRPSIVHTRNLSGLDALLPAYAAGVGIRIHGEHGRDADDVRGSNAKYRRLRRLFRPLVSHYTAVSQDLARYLAERIGVPSDRITQIYNGVDTDRFRPRQRSDVVPYRLEPPDADEPVVIGTVGRLQEVKDQITLVRAFADAVRIAPEVMRSARLVIAGDGPLRGEIGAEVERSGTSERVALIGERDDVADVLRSFDLFVLPSRDEGISNTILEAMATGLPVLATRVGGNPETVLDGEVGQLVEAQDVAGMARWIVRYAGDASLRQRQGGAARKHVEQNFSLAAMVNSYLELYEGLAARRVLAGSNNVKKSIILP